MKKYLVILFSFLVFSCSVVDETASSGKFSYAKTDPITGIIEEYTITQPENSKGKTSFDIEGLPENIENNGKIHVNFGSQHDIELIKSSFEAFKIYHYLAVVCFVLGLSIITLKWVKTLYGFYYMGLGMFLGLWAQFVPNNATLVTVLMSGLIISGIVYILLKYVPKS